MSRTLVALFALLVTCLAARAQEQPPERLDALRRVIDLEDRRETSVDAWRPLALSDDVYVASCAVRAIGRTRDPALAPLLREAASDPRLDRAVAFALGLCPDAASIEALFALASDEEAAVREVAVRSLGRLPDVAVTALVPLLRDRSVQVREGALLAMAQLRGRRARRAPMEPVVARELAETLKTLVRDEGAAWSDRTVIAYALLELELPDPARVELLQALARGGHRYQRVFVARALATGRGHETERVDALLSLLEVSEAHVAAAAASSIARIGSGCGARSPQAIQALATTAARHTGPTDHHARRAAVSALAALTRPDEAAAPAAELLVHALPAARAALDDPSPSVRIEALVAVARLAPAEQVTPLVQGRAEAERPLDRLAAARAARHLPAEARDALLDRLRQDADPRVACEALGALGELAGQGGDALARARTAARAAAAHEDMAVKTTGVSLLGEHGDADDVATIAAVASRSGGSSNAEVRVECANALKALGARDGAPQAQKAAAVAALRASLADPSAAVQVAAAKALGELTGDAVPLPAAQPTRSTVELTPEDLLRDGPNPHAVLTTSKGSIVLELLADEAPRHVKSFVALARSGFYDGLRFHRVVSGFVIQGLDPRGDGWGSGDVLVKDEINPVPYRAGTVGMPNAGPDTGGCQLFITHVPTPHLDGNYTVFGRVVEGMDVVHAIDLDDVVVSVEVRDGP